MGQNEEAAETMSLCPACRAQPEDKPNPECTTCEGVGIVSGRAYVEYQSETRRRITDD